MSSKPSRELLAYAFIAQEYSSSGSALDGVSRLLSHFVSQKSGQMFSPKDISSEVASTLGLEISPLVVESLVPSLVRLGALEQIINTGGAAAYKCKKIDDETYSLDEGEITAILAKFKAYATPLLNEHKLSFDEGDLDSAFLSFLVTADFLSSWLQSDKSEFKGNILSLKKDENLPEEILRNRSIDTVCALFIKDVALKDEQLLNKLVEISWGAVVVEVVTALQFGASGGDAGLSDLTVFVDSPILLDLLELGEIEQHKYALDLFDLLVRSKAKVATFSHVVEEMRTAVETTLARFNRGEPFSGPMAKRLRSEKGYELFARQSVAQLESKLMTHQITIVADAEFEVEEIAKYFPEKNIDSLRNRVGELHRNIERRDRDAKSIAYVLRVRRGLTASPVSMSKYVFVTRNVALCRIATSYTQSTGMVTKGAAPPCVTDRQLAGILWFCSGASASDAVALTRQKIIANCANAVAPRLDLVSKMGQVLFEHKPDRLLEYEALMRDQRAALCLTRETLNVASFVDAHEAEKFLEEMREALTEEQRAKFEKERNNLVEAYEIEKAKVESELEGSQREAKAAASRADSGERNLVAIHNVVSKMRSEQEQLSAKVEDVSGKLSELDERNARAIDLVRKSVLRDTKILAFFLTLIVVGAYGLLAWLAQAVSGVRYIGPAATIIFTILGFWIVPEYIVHPLIRKYLVNVTKRKLKKITGYSGIELNESEIVDEALLATKFGGRRRPLS